MSSSSQAGFLAKQGLGYLYSATKSGLGAISTGITHARKSYANYYEKDRLEALKKAGKPPQEVLFLILQRYYYLSLAGYENEAAACVQKAALKLADHEKSSVPPEAVSCLGSVLGDVASRYGDFSKGSWLGLQDFLNSTRMGKDHFDRDNLVNDFYFAILYLVESLGGVGPLFEQEVQFSAKQLIESSGGAPGPSSSLPAYAQVPSAAGTAQAAPDARAKAAKVVNVIASSMKKAAADSETKRQKSLRDAEAMLQREKERASQRST